MDRDWIILLAVLVPSVILHEVSHGVVALAYGDDTAKRAGRLTLNPLAHVDPFGTVILPLLLVIGGLNPFGYAKPVPVDPNRLRNPRHHSLLVSLAGPVTNIVIAVGAAAGIRWLIGTTDLPGGRLALPPGTGSEVLVAVGFVNVVLATFNLIPVPPLDGSAVIERVLPSAWLPRWHRVRQYSMGVLVLLVVAVPGFLARVFDPAIRLWTRLL